MYVFCADFVWVSYWYMYGFRADFVWIPYRCMYEFRADFVWKSYSNLVWKVVAKSHTFPINFPHLQLVHFPYESRTPLFTGIFGGPFQSDSTHRSEALFGQILRINQGRPQDLGGGGQEFLFFQIWEFACREATCCAWRSHAHC